MESFIVILETINPYKEKEFLVFMGEREDRFGVYGRVLSQGISPNLAGKLYHLSLENGNFIQISRHSEDGFRFREYKPVEGKYISISQGIVADLNWRKFLDTKL